MSINIQEMSAAYLNIQGMHVQKILALYPIGTKFRLTDDDPGTIHEVYGYEWFEDSGNIIFQDGTKLNMSRLDLVEEVLN